MIIVAELKNAWLCDVQKTFVFCWVNAFQTTYLEEKKRYIYEMGNIRPI